MPADLRLLANGVENPHNRLRIDEAAAMLGGQLVSHAEGRLIAVENTPSAASIYGRRPPREVVTLAVGNERRGVSRAILACASETVVIPALSRTVTTLNVAAAAAVAAWYVIRGSGPQARASHPERRRPTVLLSGNDHVEVGSSLRSAAAFGFRELYLEDRGAAWFEGDHHKRREARAAARRHKNALRVRHAQTGIAERFDQIVAVTPAGVAHRLARERLTGGRNQLVVIGAGPDTIEALPPSRTRITGLGLETDEPALRLVASIVLAEIARQVGQPAVIRPVAKPSGPRYERELDLVAAGELLLVEQQDLLEY